VNHPFDVVKSRMQAHDGRGPNRYKGTIQVPVPSYCWIGYMGPTPTHHMEYVYSMSIGCV